MTSDVASRVLLWPINCNKSTAMSLHSNWPSSAENKTRQRRRRKLASWTAWLSCIGAVVFFMATFHLRRPIKREQSTAITIGTGDFGMGHGGTLEITLKGCKIGTKEMWCDLTAASPGFDRGIYFPLLATKMKDASGTVFYAKTPEGTTHMRGGEPAPFRMGFILDKACALPASLALSGYVDNQPVFANFDVE